MRQKCAHAEGFTLLELMVVLIILALLVQTAVLSVEGLAEQERRTSTEISLEAMRDAILGRLSLEDPQGRPWAEGFVSDMGRLPIARTSDPETYLEELWGPSAPLAPFAIQSAPGDAEVRLPAGWRGPYLRLGVGANRWIDGWSRAFVALRTDGTAAATGDQIGGAISYGADGQSGGMEYDEDLHVTIQDPSVARHLGALSVRVLPRAGAGSLVVIRLYGPENGTLRTLKQFASLVVIGTAMVVQFNDVPVGHRVVRAYQTDTEPGWEQTVTINDPKGISEVLPIVMVHGGLPELLIDLSTP